jgi:hypothetical protein
MNVSRLKDKSRESLHASTTQNTKHHSGNSQEKNTTTEQDCNVNFEELVTAAHVAKHCKVTSRAVLLWADKGILPSLRIGNKTRRFRMSEVIAAIK